MEPLGNIGRTGIGSDYIQATTSEIHGIEFRAWKWVNRHRDESRSFYTKGTAWQLVAILTAYAEGSNLRQALDLGQVLGELEGLITTIKLAQEAAHHENPKPLLEVFKEETPSSARPG